MPARKRGHHEIVEPAQPQPVENPLLDQIRSMSEFAALCQFIFMFGKAIKIPEVDIEDLEQECILPMHSQMLSEIGLSILKFVSSFRGLTFENFEDYTRRQYLAKAPDLNPFGDEEEPKKFAEFDVFTKIRILHQLSVWTFWNPDRMREKMPDATLDEQISWRMDPCGWDAEDRIYYIFDDDRLYRQIDPPIPEPLKKKTRANPRSRSSRSSKRRRVSRIIPDTTEDEADDVENPNGVGEDIEAINYESNFDGRKWECVAVSMEEYTRFLGSIQKSRDPDEKNLHKYITNEIIPILSEKEEARQRKEQRRLKELENMEKLLSAKRSSRIANKAEQRKEQEAAEEAERKRQADLDMAFKEQERQRKIEEARQSRMMTREQRIRDREVKRILHEEQIKQEQEQLAKLSEDDMAGNGHRISERALKADLERRKRELESLEQEEDEWIFDCAVCGVHGRNLDDGTHSIACEECNVWQHSACHGIDKEQAERDDFHFVCKDCRYKKENPAPPPVPPLKVKFGKVEEEIKTAQSSSSLPKKEMSQPVSVSEVSKSQTSTSTPTRVENPISSAHPKPRVPQAYPVTQVQQARQAPQAPQVSQVPPAPPSSQAPKLPPVHQMPQTLPVLPPMRTYPGPPSVPWESAQQPKPSQAPTFMASHPPRPYVPQPIQPEMPVDNLPRPPNVSLSVERSNGAVFTHSSPSQPLPRILPTPQTPMASASTSFTSRQLPPIASPPRSFNAISTSQQSQAPLNSGIYTPNASFSANGHHGQSSFQRTPGPQGPPPSTSHSPLPAPHLPSPKQIQTPLMGQGSFSNSQNGLEGSSPGYSPMKQSSPPRPMSSNGVDGNIMNRPVTLEPRTMAPITSPPVKRASPMLPPLHQVVPTPQSQPQSQSPPSNGQSNVNVGNGNAS